MVWQHNTNTEQWKNKSPNGRKCTRKQPRSRGGIILAVFLLGRITPGQAHAEMLRQWGCSGKHQPQEESPGRTEHQNSLGAPWSPLAHGTISFISLREQFPLSQLFPKVTQISSPWEFSVPGTLCSLLFKGFFLPAAKALYRSENFCKCQNCLFFNHLNILKLSLKFTPLIFKQ